jgi:hypothetical protein
MNRTVMAGLCLALALLVMGCGVLNPLTGGDQGMRTVSQLWSDVPPMDGLTPSQMDMPLPIKLVARTVIGNLGRLNKEGEDRTTGNIDWLVFTSSKPPSDVANFYTSDRMASSGWDRTDSSPCVSGGAQGIPQVGLLCVFAKQQGGTQTQLAIIATQDDKRNETNVFFLRLEVTGTPTPGN